MKSEATNAAQLKKWQILVYTITFVAYAMSHFSRKCYTNVKSNLKEEAGMSKEMLGLLDSVFMFFYAVGSYFSGSLGDRMNPSHVVGAGLYGAGFCVVLFAAGVWFDLVNTTSSVWLYTTYFVLIWTLHGLFQSTGGPVNTAIMGNWFSKENRGLIFGTWTCHQYMGNIIAAVVSAVVLSSGYPYWWALVIPAVCNIVWGLVCTFLLPPRPADKDIDFGDTKAAEVSNADLPPPIGFIDAFKIPGVARYAISFGFFKLINYILFFWLPTFLMVHFDPSTGNLISTLYDVGMMPGGIIVGWASDVFGGRRATVVTIFLLLLCPIIGIFSAYNDVMGVPLTLIFLVMMGILIGGPNNIITSAVAADLASDPSIQGNNRALGTVTGIINGSGSITAAIGLLFIPKIDSAFPGVGVWYFMIICTLIGCALLSPKVCSELSQGSEEEPVARPGRGGYSSINRA